ncbi:hypothetical protein O3P69_003260 [Scylla paramamosain]|uniref:Uncharacterized protein n=1 Tax=Scylla paramamosain TaxID=85552 RepID=A0AAW0UNL8_SCYPA
MAKTCKTRNKKIEEIEDRKKEEEEEKEEEDEGALSFIRNEQRFPKCILADFVSTSGSEKIPYVYLPLKHQLVHPTAEVALRGLEHAGVPIMSPVCVVTGASVLTQRGWRKHG